MMTPETSSPFLQMGWFSLLSRYWIVLIVAFGVSVLLTPIMRVIALKTGVVDCPDESRKIHTKPIAYLGGVAVFFSVFAGILASYFWVSSPDIFQPFPVVVILGMVAIGLTGLADDVFEFWDPWWKVAGQLVAAAAMAQQGVGTRVAEGFLRQVLGISESVCNYALIEATQWMPDPITLTYITGLVIIAMFVLGACNAANLIDGLDGLLSGVVGITAIGFIAISLVAAMSLTTEDLLNIQSHLPKNEFLK